MRPRSLLAASVLVLSACGSQLHVPTPILPTEAAALPPAEPAVFAIPVSIALSALREELDSVFPASDSLDRAKCSALGGLVCNQYVYHRDSLDIRMFGDRITMFTRLSFRGRVVLPGVGSVASCGYDPETMRRAELRLSTTMFWRTDWHLAARATVITPTILDPCQVTVLRVDVTPTMRRILDGQVETLHKQFDSIVPAVANLKPLADSLWRELQRPLQLDSTSSVTLTLSPERMSLAPLTGTGSDASTVIVVTARPRVSFGAGAPAALVPLPPLALAPANQSGIHVPVDIELPFAEISARATALLGGEVAGKGISVNRIEVWGRGDTAVVKVDLTGRVSGALFLLGRISFDSTSRSVLIGDLQYTLESDGAMSRIKATLGASRIRHAIQEATGHGRLDVGAQLDSLRDQMTPELNRQLSPGLSIEGKVTGIRIGALATTPTAFVLRVVLDAEARVRLTDAHGG